MSALLLAFSLVAPLGADTLALDPPLIRWVMDERLIREGSLRAIQGPNPEVSGFPKPVVSPWGPALEVNDELDNVVLPWFVRREWPQDPKENFSATVAFRVDRKAPGERLAGCIFHVNGKMIGWQIRLDDGHPVLEIGHPEGTTTIRSGRSVVGTWSWVTAGYTGQEAWLMVNGVEVGRKPAPHGALPYSGRAPLAVSGYWHGSGAAPFRGQIREFRVDSPALGASRAAALHRNPEPVPDLGPVSSSSQEDLKWSLAPFLQSPLPGKVTVSFETSNPTQGIVRHGPRKDQLRNEVKTAVGTLHHARLANLPAGQPWFYQVEALDSKGNRLTQEVKEFRTLPGEDQTLRIVVTADTQSSPERTSKVVAAMLEHRPDFVAVVGDLVGEGWLKQNWREHFFASMAPLLAHVPLVPALGNHERNARLYYLLMDSPAPKSWYAFRAGAADFIVLDTEHPTDPNSPQFRWAQETLGQSKGPWKVVMHHYPAYSSGYDDLDSPTDFGGDSQARNLVPLYDQNRVTTVLAGHVHHYERTFPMRAGRVDPVGITYFTLGGGGGGLDSGTPRWRFDFSRNQRRVHHFALITISRHDFLLQVYDWDNHLFDEWRADAR